MALWIALKRSSYYGTAWQAVSETSDALPGRLHGWP
jgi:hypothetical protein